MSRPVVRTTPHVGGMYGAPMGRYGDKFDSTFAGEVKLARVALWDGGYDHGGAYWGSGTPLWVAVWDDEEYVCEAFFRASDYQDACDTIRDEMPEVTGIVRAMNVTRKGS